MQTSKKVEALWLYFGKNIPSWNLSPIEAHNHLPRRLRCLETVKRFNDENEDMKIDLHYGANFLMQRIDLILGSKS